MFKKLGLAMVVVLFIISPVTATPKEISTISVDDTVWGGTATALVVASEPAKNATVNYVFAQCWSEVDGEYLFAAFYGITDNSSTLGPFVTGSTWTQPEPADCEASVGYFTRQGFGRWVEAGQTLFNVSI